MLSVIEYFAKSCTQGHSRSFEMTRLTTACVSPSIPLRLYRPLSVSRTVLETA